MRRVQLNAVIARRLRPNARRLEQLHDLGNIFGSQKIYRHAVKFAVNREDRIDNRRLQEDFATVSVNRVGEPSMLDEEGVRMKLGNVVDSSRPSFTPSKRFFMVSRTFTNVVKKFDADKSVYDNKCNV